jgi:hypothetical protein
MFCTLFCVCFCPLPRRKHGHNEIDEPMFTQPLMYKAIRQHKNSHQRYVERLLEEGSLSKAQVRHERCYNSLGCWHCLVYFGRKEDGVERLLEEGSLSKAQVR